MKCEDSLQPGTAPLHCAHHERLAPATLNLSGCIVSPVRRPRLERGGRRFKSCHPDHHPTQAIATQLLTLHHGADAYSVGHGAVTPRSASSVLVQIQVAPPKQGPLAQSVDAAPSKGEGSWFESMTGHHKSQPRWRNGIRAGLRNQILPVRVRGGAPETRAVPSRAQSGLENRGIREGDGSIPSLPAKGRLPERQWVGLLSRSRCVNAAEVRSLYLPPRHKMHNV